MRKDQKLTAILQAPTLSAADKSAIVAELVKNAGATGDTVKNFLGTLAENNRLGLLPEVINKFGELMSAARGEVEMVVTSAQVRSKFSSRCQWRGCVWFSEKLIGQQPLDNKTLNRLESAVSKSSYVGQGKKLKVTNKVRHRIPPPSVLMLRCAPSTR